jgi:hypothetical protein
MKTLFITLLIILAIGLGVFYFTPKTSTVEISVMRDITSPHLAEPVSSEIIPFYGLSANEWNGAIFRFQNISNVSFNPVAEASISSTNEWISNEFQRNNDIKVFNGQVAQIISDSTKYKVGWWHASVYLSIANELNLLSKSPAQKRILIVYSSLMENEPNYSFYCEHTFSMLQQAPEKVKEHFEKEQPLNNLNRVEVYLIYQPVNAFSDLQYQVVAGFYKTMLTAAGAKVTITANLTN